MKVSITSLDDTRLDPYRDLKRTNRNRHEDWFIAEGRWVVERLLASDIPVISVVLSETAARSFGKLVPENVDTLIAPDDQVSQLVGFDFHSGIIACGQRPRRRELSRSDPALSPSHSTVVVCPATVLPDNLGSIIRIGCAFGVQALIVGPHSADPFSRRCVRVSMGNIFQLPIFEIDSTEFALHWLRENLKYQCLAATGRANSLALPMPRPSERIAIVLGNEAHGIAAEILAACDHEIQIPMSGATDSLNVAQAAAVLLYQFTRVSP